MNEQARKLTLSVSELRDEFDRSFAAPPPEQRTAMENLLAIRTGEGAYALRLTEIISIERSGGITPLPSRSPWLLGVSNVDGRIVPVFSLALLLGYSSDDKSGWLALCNREAPLALAFDAMVGYFQAPALELSTPSGDKPLGGSVRFGAGSATLIHIPYLVSQIKGKSPSAPAAPGAAS